MKHTTDMRLRHIQDEHKAKSKVIIQQMNAERKAIQDQMCGITLPDRLTKKQQQIW